MKPAFTVTGIRSKSGDRVYVSSSRRRPQYGPTYYLSGRSGMVHRFGSKAAALRALEFVGSYYHGVSDVAVVEQSR